MACVPFNAIRILSLLAILIAGTSAFAIEPEAFEAHNRKYRIRMVGPEWAIPSPNGRPPANRAPAALPPSEAPVPAVPAYRFSSLTVNAGLGYSALSVNDLQNGGVAQLYSDLNYSARVHWHQVWSRDWRSFGAFEIAKVNYNQIPRGYALLGADATYTGIEIGLERRVHPRFFLGATFGMKQESFIAAESLGVLRMQTLAIPQGGLAMRWVLTPPDPFGLSFESKFGLLLPTMTPVGTATWGTEILGKLKFEQQLPANRLGLGFFYSMKEYGTSLEAISKREIGIEFDIRFTFGHSSKPGGP